MNILVHKQPLLLFTYEYKNRNWTFKNIICHFSRHKIDSTHTFTENCVITSWAITNCFCSCLGCVFLWNGMFTKFSWNDDIIRNKNHHVIHVIWVWVLIDISPSGNFKGKNIWIGQNNFHVYKILSIHIYIFHFCQQ